MKKIMIAVTLLLTSFIAANTVSAQDYNKSYHHDRNTTDNRTNNRGNYNGNYHRENTYYGYRNDRHKYHHTVVRHHEEHHDRDYR